MSRKPTKAALRKNARKLWGAIIHARGDEWGCIVGDECGFSLQAHHLIPKTHAATEFDVQNGVILCAKHHISCNKLSAHGSPLAFAAFLMEHYPDEWAYAEANKNRFQTRTALFYVEQIAILTKMLEATT